MSQDEFTGSVTRVIQNLKQGESEAAVEVWDRFFQRLVSLARKRLGNAPRRLADEEDVALSVMETLIAGAAEGRFPQLSDRNELWKLLLVITRQKAVDQIRRELRDKRGGGDVRGDSIFFKLNGNDSPANWEAFLGDDPTPESLAVLNDQYRQLLEALPDETLKSIVGLKLQSFTDSEVSEKLGLAVSTVERKRRRIREIWIKLAEESESS